MYLSFFGLAKTPFHITPDPEFMFPSPGHREAYATVFYGVAERKGFVVLAGEVGTGKTTVLRYYLGKLNREQCRPIYLFNPDMTFDELLDFLLVELQIKSAVGNSTSVKLQSLHWGLVEAFKQGHNVVLLIDEAQNMPVNTLEKLRMLSNLETTRHKLLQIVLVGQPELEQMLNRHELRQLRQRIAVRATLRPLSDAECREYIQHRLTIAGTDPAEVFSKGAVTEIVRHAQGNPRTLNIVCDNALITGFGMQERPIKAGTVRQVIRDLQGGAVTLPARRRMNFATAMAAAAVVLVVAGITSISIFAVGGGDAPNSALAEPTAHERPEAHDHLAAAHDPAPQMDGHTVPVPALETRDTRSAAGLDEGAGLTENAVAPARHAAVHDAQTGTPSDWPYLGLAVTARGSLFGTETSPSNWFDAPAAEAELDTPAVELSGKTQAPSVSPELDGSVAHKTPDTSAPRSRLMPSGEDDSVRILVKEGETLRQLVHEVYGRVTPDLMAGVRRANPQIVNDDIIYHGDTLAFPTNSPGTESPRRMGSNHDQDL